MVSAEFVLSWALTNPSSSLGLMVVDGVTAGDAEFPVNVAAVRMEIRSEAVSFEDCVGAGK